MKLNHLDLQVADVQRAVLFFERLFGLHLDSSRHSPALAILSDGEGFVLVVQRRKRDDEAYPEGFHLGFLVDDEAAVLGFHARAVGEGEAVSDVIRNNRGTMVYCRSPDGFLVEVSVRRPHPPM